MELVGLMLLLLLSFPAVGGRIVMALLNISVRMEKKKQQQQWRVGQKARQRAKERVWGRDKLIGWDSKKVARELDKAERHDLTL